jgi:hypothetical protein
MALKAPNVPTKRIEASHTVINELIQALGAMGVLPHFRPSRTAAGVPTDLVTAADSSSLGTSKTLAKALAQALTAHGADTDAHSSADTIAIAAWASNPAEPADLTEVQNVLNEVKADFNTHIALATKHRGIGGQGKVAQPAAISTADATSQGTADTLANAIKVALNAHARAGAQTIEVVAS